MTSFRCRNQEIASFIRVSAGGLGCWAVAHHILSISDTLGTPVYSGVNALGLYLLSSAWLSL